MNKVGVVGNREGWNYSFVKHILETLGIDNTWTIISGGAEGVDSFAQQYAKEKGSTLLIYYPNPLIESPNRYFERNSRIAKDCNFLLAFDKKSGASGTKNTIATAARLGKEVFIYSSEQRK